MATNAYSANTAGKSERMLQLASALLFAERGLTKREIYRAISAYHSSAADIDEGSIDRKFERDKTDLRASGVQIESVTLGDDPDDVRYVISRDTFVWPTHVDLTARQVQLLKLAAQVWSRASLQSDALQALIKLRALGVEPAKEDLVGIAPRVRTFEPAFLPLTRAVDEQIEVEFTYRRPDGEITERLVQPWSLQNIAGEWLLISYEPKSKAVRNFLLKRIISKIKLPSIDDAASRFTVPNQQDIDAAVAELNELIEQQIATLRIKRDTAAWFHFHMDDQPTDELQLHFMDLHLLAEELRTFALDLTILEPKELIEAVRQGFERVASDHA